MAAGDGEGQRKTDALTALVQTMLHHVYGDSNGARALFDRQLADDDLLATAIANELDAEALERGFAWAEEAFESVDSEIAHTPVAAFLDDSGGAYTTRGSGDEKPRALSARSRANGTCEGAETRNGTARAQRMHNRRIAGRKAVQLAATLVLALGLGMPAMANPLAHCDSSDPNELWCASMTVGTQTVGGSLSSDSALVLTGAYRPTSSTIGRQGLS